MISQGQNTAATLQRLSFSTRVVGTDSRYAARPWPLCLTRSPVLFDTRSLRTRGRACGEGLDAVRVAWLSRSPSCCCWLARERRVRLECIDVRLDTELRGCPRGDQLGFRL